MDNLTELKAVVGFAITLGMALDKALADHKVDITDLPLLMAPLMQVGSAVSAIGKVDFKTISKEDMAALVAFVAEDLHLASARTEKLIEESLALAVNVLAFVESIKAK